MPVQTLDSKNNDQAHRGMTRGSCTAANKKIIQRNHVSHIARGNWPRVEHHRGTDWSRENVNGNQDKVNLFLAVQQNSGEHIRGDMPATNLAM